MQAIILENVNTGKLVNLREVIPPQNNCNNATKYVTGSPYRRVYQDSAGFWCKVKGQRKQVLLTK